MHDQLILVENSGEEFSCKFDGRKYVFRKGTQVPLTIEAAKHIFGFGLDDKTEVLSRHGWMLRSTEYEEALKRLDGFKFSMGTMKVIPDAPALENQEQEQPYIEPESDTADNGQSSAPLQSGAEGGAEVTDGTEAKPSAPTQQRRGRPPRMMTLNQPG